LAGIVNLVIDAGVKKYRQAGADLWGGEKREAVSRIFSRSRTEKSLVNGERLRYNDNRKR